jgi:hypothetical protein
LTTNQELRIRQLALVVYSARGAAEKAGAVYRAATKRMHEAEINMARAVNERRAQIISG